MRSATRRMATIDCEFNGFGGRLISMAIVLQDGTEFYQVKQIPETVHPWVAVNVLPVLNKSASGPDLFKKQLHVFLKAQEPLLIVADWPTDIEHLMREMLGEKHDESIMCDITIKLLPVQYVSEVPHNALADARALLSAVVLKREL